MEKASIVYSASHVKTNSLKYGDLTRYGLIIPNKNKGVTITRPSIFDEDSDSDTPKLSTPTGLARTRKQDKISQGKALQDDPTVYQYDEVYDKIEKEKVESKLAKKDKDKKPKYITHLLAAAERRKRENEKRIEKQVQKEREAEGDLFKDKESFITSSYKKKLEELKALEEQEKREEYLEAIGDVTKQGNLDGFYRHLFDQKVNYEDKIKKEVESDKDSEEEKEHVINPNEANKRRKRTSGDDSTDGEMESKKIKTKTSTKKRKYRSRKDSDNNSDNSERTEIKKEHLQSNLDADSDFSIDSSSDSEKEQISEKDKNVKEQKSNIEHKGEKLQLPEKGNVLSDNVALAKKNDDKDNKSENKDNSKDEKEQEETNEKEQEVKPRKPKIDIWKKRTVGAVFDEAVKRYFERTAAREAERQV